MKSAASAGVNRMLDSLDRRSVIAIIASTLALAAQSAGRAQLAAWVNVNTGLLRFIRLTWNMFDKFEAKRHRVTSPLRLDSSTKARPMSKHKAVQSDRVPGNTTN